MADKIISDTTTMKMNGLATYLISTGAVTMLSFTLTWYQNRKRKAEKEREIQAVLTSPNTSWKKVGSIKEIYIYPLKSAKGLPINECNFEPNGLSVDKEGLFSVKDRMFLVYDESIGKFKTARQHPKLLLVETSAVGEDNVKLEVEGMPTLTFVLPKTEDADLHAVKCTMCYNEAIKCLDCGPEASAWISKYLTGSETGLRLGMCIPNYQRVATKGAWEKFAKLYTKLRDEDMGLFSDLAAYMLLSELSVDDLNQRLDKNIKSVQLRPNIVLEGCSEPYAEDQWNWIKIGDGPILRNFKPCTRCSMVRIDPDSAIPDPKSEPLKTLRTYRKLKDAELDKVEDHAPHIGIYCGLYRTGQVKVGDDIYVYQPSS